MHAGTTDRIAFLGGGNMARALIAGLLRQGLPAARIHVGEPRETVRQSLARDLGVLVTDVNADAIRAAALVVLAVKPQDAPGVLRGLQQAWGDSSAVLLSVAAGLTIATVARICPPGLSIVRAMPNRAALVGAGVTGLYAHPELSERARGLAQLIGTAAGRTVWVRTEAELDLVTALSGSGPAYFFLLAEQLAQTGEALGLTGDTAMLLAAETLYGAGQLAHGSAASSGGAAGARALAEERNAVTSRGGTTEAALRVLHEGGFDSLIARALQAAASRSAELAGDDAARSLSPQPP